MRNKSKLSITIDNKILKEVEKVSNDSNFSKSQLTEEALKLWFKKNNEKLMAKGYEEMAKEDQEFSESTLAAQKETIYE